LKSTLGMSEYGRLLTRHDELFRQSLRIAPSGKVLNETGDGFFVSFDTVGDALKFALRFQWLLRHEQWKTQPVRARMGVHLGEVTYLATGEGEKPRVVGLAADLAARVTSLAEGGQILLTRGAFDEARQSIREYPTTDGESA